MSAKTTLWTLTAVAAATEVGLLVRLFAVESSLWIVPLVLAAYHTGYLAAGAGAVRLIPVPFTLLVGTAASMLCLGVVTLNGAPLLIGAAGFSAVIQTWRRALKPQAPLSSPAKNAAKALGMVSAALLALPAPALAVAAMPFVVALVVFSARGTGIDQGIELRDRRIARASRRLLWAEALHHAHYFTYAYVFWALMTIPPALIAPAFVLGWLGYFVAERTFRERVTIFSPTVFAVGHLVCAGALGVAASVPGTVSGLAAWTITGIGGGTAFMLGNTSGGRDPARERSEDLGHVGGCFVSAGAVAAAGPVGALAMAASIAAATALMVACSTLSSTTLATSNNDLEA